MSQAIDMSGGLPGPADLVARASLLKRLVRNPLGLFALVVLAVVALAAVLGPMIAPFDENFSNIDRMLAPAGGEHLLGTDSAGRDVWSRLLFGARLTLLSGLLCAVVAIAVGLPTGLVAGYYGGWFDSVPNWVANLLMSLPGIIVLLSVRAAFGPSVWVTMIVFGILISPGFFRLTRAAVQSVRSELYVDAARVAGLGDARIIGRHIMSVVRAPLIIQTAMVAGVAIAVQSGLEFLGLGDPQQATWGVMLSDGFENIYVAPSLLVWPALVIGLTTGAFVLLGNAVRDALEDRQEAPAAKTVAIAAEPGRDVAAEAPASSGDHLLEVSHLSVGYPRPDGGVTVVVDDISFHVDRGEVLAIVGESGSGKTQTAFSILGLLPDTARIVGGSICFDGTYTVAPTDQVVVQSRLTPLRGRRISYIPQEPMSNLDQAFTIGYQLVRPMVKVLGISRAEARTRALDLLARVGIPNPQRTFAAYPHEVSGGMAQRVLIAGAVSCEPDLVIADEPTTALDVTVQAEVLDLLREMQAELGVGVVLVTHDFGVVADLADRVAVMQNGRIVEDGPVRDVLRSPHDRYTQTLLASMLAAPPSPSAPAATLQTEDV